MNLSKVGNKKMIFFWELSKDIEIISLSIKQTMNTEICRFLTS
ncbi:hypothetical protein H1P_2200010 [Hyella patelloides LEGE 07179]|uniref:Uncharacterized protein n=1 Tax=Hyella patelloides LEGE 07179 TaxID=945734 RepID=A0A563VR16_9CYAN|nr:hypothetical protein H1P_2200010 [Hyella patelloides LEGE 07179]